MAGKHGQGDEILTRQPAGYVGITRLGWSHGLRSAAAMSAERTARETEDDQPFVNEWQLLQSIRLSVTCLSWMNVKVPVLALWQDAQSALPSRVGRGA